MIEYVEIPAFMGPAGQFVEIARCTAEGCGRGWYEVGKDTRPPCKVLMYDGEACGNTATCVARNGNVVTRCCDEHAKGFTVVEAVPPRPRHNPKFRRPGTGYY